MVKPVNVKKGRRREGCRFIWYESRRTEEEGGIKSWKTMMMVEENGRSA
jgi:hypothetical protein